MIIDQDYKELSFGKDWEGYDVAELQQNVIVKSDCKIDVYFNYHCTVIIFGSLIVEGDLDINNNLKIFGDLVVNGNLTSSRIECEGDLVCYGDISSSCIDLRGDLICKGSVKVWQSLVVEKNLSVLGDVDVEGALVLIEYGNIGGDLTVWAEYEVIKNKMSVEGIIDINLKMNPNYK